MSITKPGVAYIDVLLSSEDGPLSWAKNTKRLRVIFFVILMLFGNPANATDYVGSTDYSSLLTQDQIKDRLSALLGKDLGHLNSNLNVHAPISSNGREYILSGNAAHHGCVEEAILTINIQTNDVDSVIYTSSNFYVYSQTKKFAHLPEPIKDWMWSLNGKCAQKKLNNIIWK